jgi:4-amino-4-deoxy-L-arabinose transferase-like glycosyltransferase
MTTARSSAAREWLVITILTVAGAVLRLWAFARVSLTHFDEGIYAFAGLWSLSRQGLRGLDPGVIAYAPPGFPILVGLSYVVFGVSDYAAIAVSIVAGIATIPVVGWLGRRTFGPGAGAAAAAFAALSMAHVAFSRRALTDAPFLLAWLVAIGVGMRFLERPGCLRALALGAAVGIAQNFKYNGWLSGVIVAAAAVAGVLFQPDDRRRGPLLRTFGWGLVAAVVAASIYAPWYAFVENHGGYADLIRHHRGYTQPAQWRSNWSLQLGEAFALSGPPYVGAITGLLAWLVFGIATNPRGVRRATGLFTLLCALEAYLPWWIGLGWTPWILSWKRPSFRLLGAWWLLSSALTPLYHPYARLWLPIHALGWLLQAGFVLVLAGPGSEESMTERHRRVLAGIAVACGISAAIQATLAQPHAFALEELLAPKDSLRDFAFEVLPQRIPEKGTMLRLYARRPLAFYLFLQGGYRIKLEPDGDALWSEQSPGSWRIVDGMMPAEGVHFRGPTAVLSIDPITALDYEPGFAFEKKRELTGGMWLLNH